MAQSGAQRSRAEHSGAERSTAEQSGAERRRATRIMAEPADSSAAREGPRERPRGLLEPGPRVRLGLSALSKLVHTTSKRWPYPYVPNLGRLFGRRPARHD